MLTEVVEIVNPRLGGLREHEILPIWKRPSPEKENDGFYDAVIDRSKEFDFFKNMKSRKPKRL